MGPFRKYRRLKVALTRTSMALCIVALSFCAFEGALYLISYPRTVAAAPEDKDQLLAAQRKAIKHSSENAFYPPGEQIPIFAGEFNVIGTADSLGYLGVGKPDPEQRDLLVFGCSFAYGFGVAQSETFASWLGAYNAGLWGLSFPHHARAFERVVDVVQPRRAIWILFPPHLITVTHNPWRTRQIDPEKHPLASACFKEFNRTRTSKAILQATGLGCNRSNYYTCEFSLYDKDDDYVEHGYEVFEGAVKSIVASASKRGVRVIPVFMPSKRQLALASDGKASHLACWGRELDARYPIERMADILEKGGIPREQQIDLLPVLVKAPWRDLYFKRDAHLNPSGCKFVAAYLRQKGM